jgi:beta-glucosidase
MPFIGTAQALEIEAHITALLRQMTLAEKIGQMTLVDKRAITPEEVRDKSIGGVLSGGGANPAINSPQQWLAMVQSYSQSARQSRLGIPLLYGVDAIHGHNNVKGAVIFPHNIGLGATRSPHLVERIGQITAREVQATGVCWNFAPAAIVAHDIRWGRTYESFSEDTALVTALTLAYLRGLRNPELGQGEMLPSVKHYVGDGGTTWNSRLPTRWLTADDEQEPTERYMLDQGDARIYEETLAEVYMPPFAEAVKAGALNIMVSHCSWNGTRLHRHRYLLTDVLKKRLGFEGFLVSDWGSLNYLDPDFYTGVVMALNAGIDMVMLPNHYQRFTDMLKTAVENAAVPLERIDDAVSRILRAKFRVGLFDHAPVSPQWVDLVGCSEHRAVAREAVRQSLVLLKNDNRALPLSAETPRIHVAGAGAADIGLACGGWTIEWQGSPGPITDGTTLLDGLRCMAKGEVVYHRTGGFASNADSGIVVVAEPPYAEGHGDSSTLALTAEDVHLIKTMREHCQRLILVIYSGRPLMISDILPDCDAVVAAWLPGSEAGEIAAVLFGKTDFSGRLPFSWPVDLSQVPLSALKTSERAPLWPFGFGLSYPDNELIET